MKYEYRVVSKREGMQRQKEKRYATKEGADRRLALLVSKSPWTITHPGDDPDDLFCCSGYECGCGGQTIREWHDDYTKSLPKLLFAGIHRREVGEWSAYSS